MPPVGNFGRGKVSFLSLVSVGFLVISLVSIVSFTNNPVKNQIIKIFAWTPEGFDKPEKDIGRPRAVKKADEKEPVDSGTAATTQTGSETQVGVGEFGWCYSCNNGNGAPADAGTWNDPNAEIAGTYIANGKRYIIDSPDTRNAAYEYNIKNPGLISGTVIDPLTHQAVDLGVNLTDQVNSIINAINSATDPLEIEKWYRQLKALVDRGIVKQEYYTSVVEMTDARLLLRDVVNAKTIEEREPLLTQLKAYADRGVITQDQYRSAVSAGTIQSIVDAINNETDPLRLEKWFSQLQKYVNLEIITKQYYDSIVGFADAKIVISEISKTSDPQQRAELLTRLKAFADQGVITQDAYNQVSKYYVTQEDYNQCVVGGSASECGGLLAQIGEPKQQTTTQNITVEKTDTGFFKGAYEVIISCKS